MNIKEINRRIQEGNATAHTNGNGQASSITLKEISRRIQEVSSPKGPIKAAPAITIPTLESPSRPQNGERKNRFLESIVTPDLPNPHKQEFWQELKIDLENARTKDVSFINFLSHSNRRTKSTDPNIHPNDTLPYRKLIIAYSQKAFLEPGSPALDTFLRSQFQPPQDNPEFQDLVKTTRALIEQKFPEQWEPAPVQNRPSDSSQARVKNPEFKPKLKAPAEPPKEHSGRSSDFFISRINDPEFWKEFYEDLSSTKPETPFSIFFQFYTPEGTQKPNTHGKYSEISNAMYLKVSRYQLQEEYNRAKDKKIEVRSARDVQRIFFEEAPPEVQALLKDRFPKIFGQIAQEISTGEKLLPSEVQEIVGNITWLGDDKREMVLEKLAAYTAKKREGKSRITLSSEDIKRFLNQTVEDSRIDVESVEGTTLESILRSGQNFLALLQETQSEDPQLAELSKELINALEDSYYIPVLKNAFYKDAVIFWNNYRKENPHEETVSGKILEDFLKESIEAQKESLSLTEEEEGLFEYLKGRILPQVYEYFGQIINFAPKVKFFKEGEGGNFLFLHQIEGIKELIEREGGILADEPGTGKTVILALAALNLIEQKAEQKMEPGRVLVVGTKTVIDNWEEELGFHVEDANLKIVNVNFVDPHKKSGQKPLSRRINDLENELSQTDGKTQMVLVNYDIFRDPSFQKLIAQIPFDVTIVDETHNVKSRFLESILKPGKKELEEKSRVAKRTRNLYGFLKSNPKMAVFLATSTPFVKELIEPLIMAHLASGGRLTSSDVLTLMDSPTETSRVLRKHMVRRKKELIADLPEKETRFTPLDLDSLPPEDKATFEEITQIIQERHKSPFSRFYAQLSLETQAKLPWLVETVQEIVDDERKVVIFTPFVKGENRLTSSISTTAIANYLKENGIESVGILDGRLDEFERLEVQRDFHSKDGIKVLVGNYLTAGESITLNSPQNRATDVIIFVSPNAISRYIQAVDRIHRFGQQEKVTVHVPFVTRGPQNTGGETYDERIVKRLIRELATFNAVVDGLFFIETKDYYQDITTQKRKASRPVVFSDTSERTSSEKPKPMLNQRKRLTGSFTLNSTESSPESQETVFFQSGQKASGEVNIRFSANRNTNLSQDMAEADAMNSFFSELRRYPLLTASQEKIIFEHFVRGDPLSELVQNESFQSSIAPAQREKMAEVLKSSKDIKEVLVKTNLRLVAHISQRYKGALPYMDLLQEGSIGLMAAIDRFEPSLGYKLSTYASWWIRQAVVRAIADKSRLIRFPVHLNEALSKTSKIIEAYNATHGRNPQISELEEMLTKSGEFPLATIKNITEIASSGISNVVSLDMNVGDEEESSLGDIIADSGPSVEDEIEKTELGADIDKAFKESLTPREALVLERRFGLQTGEPESLEDIGRHLGVTRERIRQIQLKALYKLRKHQTLQALHQNFPQHTNGTISSPMEQKPFPVRAKRNHDLIPIS